MNRSGDSVRAIALAVSALAVLGCSSAAPRADRGEARTIATRERVLVDIDDLEPSGQVVNSDASPSEHVEQKHTYLALYGAVEALPTRERTVVEMRYFDEMTGKAVASALGLSEARVCQLHARAIDRLRRNLDETELLAA